MNLDLRPDIDSDTPALDGERAQATLRSIGDALLCTDTAGRVTYLNPVAARMTGWSCAQAIGRPAADVLRIADAVTREPVRNPLLRAMQENRTVRFESDCVLLRADGPELAIEDSAAPIYGAAGQVVGAVIVFRDVTGVRSAARRAAHLARHDPLTGLPNRMLLRDRLESAVALAQRHGKRGAVLFLDLDGFKSINDTRGHAVGDHLLRSVARRLLACTRATDTVSREGGDEFLVLLSEIEHAADAALGAQKICMALARAYDSPGEKLRVTASIGISIFPQDGQDVDALIHHADQAMYGAKQEGRGGYRFYADVSAVAVAEGEFPKPASGLVRSDSQPVSHRTRLSAPSGRGTEPRGGGSACARR